MSEFLMLAHIYDPEKDSPAGHYMSEKLDGVRCLWDGGVSRGLECALVPWANTAKHERYVETRFATGLWTRYGQPIYAPSWFLDVLPRLPLDGELTMGRGTFQDTMSCIRSLEPSDAWKKVSYAVFDSPPPATIFADREIKNTNFRKEMVGALQWFKDRYNGFWIDPFLGFGSVLGTLSTILPNEPYNDLGIKAFLHRQQALSQNTMIAKETVIDTLDGVCKLGGEGLMLRAASSFWMPERSHRLLKVKPHQDAEGTVIGYTWGRATDKGSKLLGLMGNLIVQLDSGVTFELSGFTEVERRLSIVDVGSPGQHVDDSVTSSLFPRGSRITFKYRELTRDGVPKEARYWRKA